MNNQYYQQYPYYNTFYNPYYNQQLMVQQQLYSQQMMQQQNSQPYIYYQNQQMLRITPEQREILQKQTPDENLLMFKCKDGMKCINATCIYFHHPKYNFEESK
jgi:hypothetical protein